MSNILDTLPPVDPATVADLLDKWQRAHEERPTTLSMAINDAPDESGYIRVVRGLRCFLAYIEAINSDAVLATAREDAPEAAREAALKSSLSTVMRAAFQVPPVAIFDVTYNVHLVMEALDTFHDILRQAMVSRKDVIAHALSRLQNGAELDAVRAAVEAATTDGASPTLS